MSRTAPLTARTASVIALPLVGILLLSACSGPGGGGGDRKPEDSPLAQYMSALYGGNMSEEEQIAQFEEQNAKTEELVAECMVKEGFEYIPNINNGSSISFSSDSDWDPENREWVSQWGYGMISSPMSEEMPDPGTEQEYVDVNAEYTESLSESELTAYYEALWGPQPTEEELNDDGSYEYNWEDAGCYGAAQHETQGDDPMGSEEHKPITDAINEFYTNMAQAPELADLDKEWASCMADAGEGGFTSQFDAQGSISEELNKYYESQTEWIENDPKLDELQEKEIELALIDLDCREKTDYRAKYTDVQWKLEEQFIADHKAELDALKAAAEQGK